jgi:hypothetical protein
LPGGLPDDAVRADGWLKTVDPNGDKLHAYFVSVDPERDTPEVMNQYVSNVSKRIVGISGAPDKVADVIKGYRVYAKKVPVDENDPNGDYTMDHTASVFLLDSAGTVRRDDRLWRKSRYGGKKAGEPRQQGMTSWRRSIAAFSLPAPARPGSPLRWNSRGADFGHGSSTMMPDLFRWSKAGRSASTLVL